MDTTEDRIASDRTPMTTCPTCASPVDISGRSAATAYIHLVEADRQVAEDDKALILFALEPFAAMANRYGDEHPDSTVVMTWKNQPVVTLGDLRRAKAYVDRF